MLIMEQFKNLMQYKKCLYQYAMRTRFRYGAATVPKIAMLKSVGKFTPIFTDCNSNSKLIQYKKMLKAIKVDCHLNNGFLYFIDEKVVPYNAYSVIDNMPLDYSIVVDYSLDDLRNINSKKKNDISAQNTLLLDEIEEFISRIEKHSDASNKKQISYLVNMKTNKAESLEEALQRILFWNMLLNQTDHLLNGFGRLDKILDRFSEESDIGIIIENFLNCLHSYYEYKSNAVLGDTGQIIILGGLEEDGTYFFNKITYEMLRAFSKLKLPDPKALLRVSKNMPEDLLRLAVDCIATGCGTPLLSDDDKVIPAIEWFGYDHQDAVNYAVSACWEPLIPGKSLEQNNLFDINFGKVFVDTYSDERFIHSASIDDVVLLYKEHLETHLEVLKKKLDLIVWERDPICTLFSLDCLNNNKDISEGGSKYNNYGLLSVGLASAVDSLININRFVFNEQKYTLEDVVHALSSNYKDNDQIRSYFTENTNGFGSNSKESLALTEIFLNCVEDNLKEYRNPLGGRVKFGLSSPAYVNGGIATAATADGRTLGEPFRTHISKDSPYAMLDVMEFSSKLNFNGCRSNGNVADIMIQTSMVLKDKEKLFLYLWNCLKSGFFQAQFNVLTYAQLVDAKAHPEKYPSLIVRVWGFSAYFNDLPEEYKDALIERAKRCMEN